MEQSRGDQFERDGDKGRDPKRRFEIGSKAVELIPIHEYLACVITFMSVCSPWWRT